VFHKLATIAQAVLVHGAVEDLDATLAEEHLKSEKRLREIEES